MKIAICGSMTFAREMLNAKSELEKFGHEVVVPNDADKYAGRELAIEDKWKKIEGNLIKNWFNVIKNSDAILVLNITKNNIENYIGGNALIETAFAHVLDKSIFLLNPIPEMNYSDEIISFNPKILHGDLAIIN